MLLFLIRIPIDVWAAGIIFLSILSTRFPFFRNQDDDMSALAELATVFGTNEIKRIAGVVARKVSFGFDCPKVPMKELCTR